jgi:hypothetical protein
MTRPFPQDPAHGNGTCKHCGQPCAVSGPRWCAECYYVDGVPRDRLVELKPGPSLSPDAARVRELIEGVQRQVMQSFYPR